MHPQNQQDNKKDKLKYTHIPPRYKRKVQIFCFSPSLIAFKSFVVSPSSHNPCQVSPMKSPPTPFPPQHVQARKKQYGSPSRLHLQFGCHPQNLSVQFLLLHARARVCIYMCVCVFVSALVEKKQKEL